MRISRLYVDQPLTGAQTIELGVDAANYLGRALRARRGDALILFDGSGSEFHAVVTALERRRVTLDVGEATGASRESTLRISLLQGLARGERMDYVVQKATELGVTSILPVQTEFAQVSLSDERSTRRRDHWRGVAIAAAQQSGRTRVPSIHDVQTLASALAVSSTEDEGLRLVADTQSHGAWPVCDASRVTIAIGPEGGFSDTERAALDAHGFAAIGLGPRVLRTETAAITALTLIQCRYGDLP